MTIKALFLLIAMTGAAVFNGVPAFGQTSGSAGIEELKKMVLELKKENEEKNKEIEQMKKENSEKIQALEEKVNELSQERAGSASEEAEEKVYAESEVDGDGDEQGFFERINEGDKPYKKLFDEGPFRLEWGGYADILASWYDHGPNRNLVGGAEQDSRLEFDLTRFVLELEGEMFAGLGFEAEIEFEHGGTGSAFEIEHEEFGEFEQEVEKGGEVEIEQLYLSKKLGRRGKLKAGRFYVAFGLIQFLEVPTHYLAARRPEAELNVIPTIWDEIGVSFEYYTDANLNLTLQLINGLDSTGFGSLNWIRDGHQGKFETIRADGLALVGRADYTVPGWGLLAGTSCYFGFNTNANRPGDDLDDVDSSLLLVDAHTVWRYGRWRANGLVMYGHLWNADEISERNSRLPNALEVPRTAVSDNAFSTWGEVGYDIAGYIGLDRLNRLEPFVRVDYYDTVFNPRASLFDNPRYEVTVLTGGLSYTFAKSVFVKLDYGYRTFGSPALRDESTIDLAWGFVY